MLLRTLSLSILFSLALAGCATKPWPEAKAPQALVAAADPRAAQAGADILAKGGSATDAAIASMMVLSLVEPQSAGVGGGGFLMHYDGLTTRITGYDGREQAPAAATPDMFLGPDGKPMNFRDAVTSGKSVGGPSLIAMLALAHKDQGRLRWAELFEPAIKLAEDGFEVSARLNQMITMTASRGGLASAEARVYLLDAEGKPLPVGTVLKNPAFAASLRQIQKQGPKALQEGPIAAAIIASVKAEPRPGGTTMADLKNISARRVTPVCGAYRAYRLCGMPPPSSGGVAVLELLSLFEKARPYPEGPQSLDDWHAFAWASRLAYADRDFYVADDSFVPVPVYGLVAPQYVSERAKLIDPAKAAPTLVEPGDPSKVLGGESLMDKWGREQLSPSTGTTHLSVVDAAGNAVALTASVESLFGSQRMAGGFFLNNQLTDFSLSPTLNGKPVANAVAPGKRPRSSMSPTLIMDKDNKLVATLGSPGGNAIIAYVAKSVIGVVDWKLSMNEAFALPNVIARRAEVRAEVDKMPPALVEGLRAKGWKVEAVNFEQSGLHGVKVTPDGLQGGADPRREGAVASPKPPVPAR
jgi:gamma-glutamyltranspeptidase/glutathione hydrolase